MREIKIREIKDTVRELFLEANFDIGPHLMNRLMAAKEMETSETGKAVLQMIIDNNKIAASEEIAICQDTGLAVLFLEIGQEVCITGGEIREAINEGVKEAYEKGYLRKSVVDDPLFERKNTRTNTPAIIYTDIVPGDKIRVLVTPKGFGSENMSALGMLNVAAGRKGVIDFVVNTVIKAGPNPCPPTIIGVGIGGTADMAMVLAKKATIRDIGEPNHNEMYAELEREILDRINNSGIGPAGLGGNVTSLAVHINYYPTHIAGMPVAVNICCHASRHAEAVI